jgi:hypothetical protein
MNALGLSFIYGIGGTGALILAFGLLSWIVALVLGGGCLVSGVFVSVIYNSRRFISFVIVPRMGIVSLRRTAGKEKEGKGKDLLHYRVPPPAALSRAALSTFHS